MEREHGQHGERAHTVQARRPPGLRVAAAGSTGGGFGRGLRLGASLGSGARWAGGGGGRRLGGSFGSAARAAGSACTTVLGAADWPCCGWSDRHGQPTGLCGGRRGCAAGLGAVAGSAAWPGPAPAWPAVLDLPGLDLPAARPPPGPGQPDVLAATPFVLPFSCMAPIRVARASPGADQLDRGELIGRRFGSARLTSILRVGGNDLSRTPCPFFCALSDDVALLRTSVRSRHLLDLPQPSRRYRRRLAVPARHVLPGLACSSDVARSFE